MKYFLDTEFNERPGSIELISIGIASDDDRYYYAVSSEFSEEDCNPWVKKNVLPKLGDRQRKDKATIRDEILEFVSGTKPEFWAYYADYDWVLFCWLFGAMVDLPEHFPMLCLDLQQEVLMLKLPPERRPPKPEGLHNALQDAIWNKKLHKLLHGYRETRHE